MRRLSGYRDRFDPAVVSVALLTRAITDLGLEATLLSLKDGAAATGPPAKDCGFKNAFC